MKNKKMFFFLIVFAIAIKLSLFIFALLHAPESKIEPDTGSYLKPATVLASEGVFATKDENGLLKYEVLRTPGYPLFLAVFYNLMRIPLEDILLLQILLTILAALIVYKAAVNIDSKIGFLSMAIILFDPPILIFSVRLMTESLFLFLISLFTLSLILYLKNRTLKMLISTALLLTAATYVRPVTYYLGVIIAMFIIYANLQKNLRKGLLHALIFFIITYCLLGIWRFRNYMHTGQSIFSSFDKINGSTLGLLHSYAINHDPFSKGLPPFLYYVNVTFRCLMSLMTRPGAFKYFDSKILFVVGKIFSYPWMVFWMTGFIVGLVRTRRNIYYQAVAFITLYFIGIYIVGSFWLVCERYRISFMPFIAIISAYGWTELMSFFNKKTK